MAGSGRLRSLVGLRLLAQQVPVRRKNLKDQAPQWDGDRLDGCKIFLHTTLDGFGDAIQMARYIPLVKAMGGHVTLVCYPSLGRLFIQSGDRLGFDCIIAEGARVPAAVMEHDVQAALMSLPAIFKTMPETIPDAHCLVVGEETVERWRPMLLGHPGIPRRRLLGGKPVASPGRFSLVPGGRAGTARRGPRGLAGEPAEGQGAPIN